MAFRLGNDLTFIQFRADEGVQLPSWDGLTVANKASTFVPIGPSAWELGTGDDPKKKANSDYAKRTGDPKDLDPKSSTFVFVTARRWNGKDDWVKEKKAQNDWLDVWAFDADDLALFIEQTPGVAIWLLGKFGMHIEGAVGLDYFWEAWSNATTPPIDAKFEVADREELKGKTIEWLKNGNGVLSIKGETPEQATAFVAAAIKESAAYLEESLVSEMVVVESQAALRQLAQTETRLTLILLLEDKRELPIALSNGHRVIVPLGASDQIDDATLVLPTQRRDAVQKVLEVMGLSFEKSWDLAALARKSNRAFRRALGLRGVVAAPTWSNAEKARALVGPILAGSWRSTSDNDRAIIEKLSGLPYAELEAHCTTWASEPDTPISRTGEIWKITSRLESWQLLGQFLTETELDRFDSTVNDTLTAIDPAYELEQKLRIMAEMLGKKPPASHQLIQGLAQTLAIMSAYSDRVKLPGNNGEVRARLIVRSILKKQGGYASWASIAFILPLLAEAAPEEFLTVLESDLSGDNPNLLLLFEDNESSVFGSRSPHSSLLWALETIAWNPKYLARSCVLLAKLSRLEPGGKTLNRPFNSLSRILLPLYPCTSAPLKQRLAVLDLVRDREPEISWALMKSMIPEHQQSVQLTSKPDYHDWVPSDGIEVKNGELFESISEIIDRMMRDAELKGDRWVSILGLISQSSQKDFYNFIERLKEVLGLLTPGDRQIVHKALRHVVAKHLRFRDADWTIPDEELQILRDLSDSTKPTEGYERISWLFVGEPDIFLQKPDWQDREAEANRLRLEAMDTLYAEGSVKGIFELADVVEFPGIVGRVLAKINLNADDEAVVLREGLGSANGKLRDLAANYALQKVIGDGGAEWSEAIRTNPLMTSLSPLAQADFYNLLPFNDSTWDKLDEQPEAVHNEYWVNVSIWGRGDYEDVDPDRVAEQLLSFGRAGTAMMFLSLVSRGTEKAFNPEFGFRAIEDLVYGKCVEPFEWSSIGWQVGQLMKVLYDSGADPTRLATLEYLLFPLLERQHERGPQVIYKQLSEDPSFYLQLVKDVAKDLSGDFSEEEVNLRAERASEILRSWKSCPGLSKDGEFNEDTLGAWVIKAREVAQEANLVQIMDQYIGKILRYAPKGSDGAWPHEAVRKILEDLQSEDVERSIETEIYNSRGITVRSQGDGGEQERALVSEYQKFAETLRETSPRVASMLDRVADDYRHDAERQDIRADLQQDE